MSNQAELLLNTLTKASDRAVEILENTYYRMHDVNEAGSIFYVEGIRAMMKRGDHRGAIYSILVTRNYVQLALVNNASEDEKQI